MLNQFSHPCRVFLLLIKCPLSGVDSGHDDVRHTTLMEYPKTSDEVPEFVAKNLQQVLDIYADFLAYAGTHAG